VRRTVVILAAVAALVVAPLARADGDPASDYLLVDKVFLPFDAKFSKSQQAEFSGVVDAANKAGYPIRVAVIATTYDMGSVTSLYRKPRTYARFLGLELSFVYKQRLLVVMPNGFGFNWPKHSPAAAYAVLGRIPIAPGPAGLLTAAQAAVEKLTAANGVKLGSVKPAAMPGHRTAQDRLTIILIAVGVLVAAAALRLVLRRRRARGA
jgi:hypothetical protein